jgi:S-DNA-T family DNA segregation ATPase FtsK/SpoIIIE
MAATVRRQGPQGPQGELVLEPPPELAEAPEPSVGKYLMYLPMLGGAGAMVFMYSGAGATPMTYAASGMYGLSSFGMIMSQLGRDTGDRTRKLDGDRRDYLRYLTQARRRVRKAAADQADAQFWNHPDPDCLWSYAVSSRLWERSPKDPDFGQVRIGLGPQRLGLRLVPPETKPAEDLDPICSGALRAFVAAHRAVPELPVAIGLRRYARISFRGDQRAARRLIRALICQAAVFHQPQDLRVAVCADPARPGDWEWTKWLPHALHPAEADAAGPVRLLRTDLAELEGLLGADLAERPRFQPGRPAEGRAHLLVVLDGGRIAPGSQLALGDAAGVTVLDLRGALDQPAGAEVLRLRVEREWLGTVSTNPDGEESVTAIGIPDGLAVAQAEALAHLLLPSSVTAGPAAASGPAPEGFTSLLRIGADPALLDPAVTWRPRAGRDRLRVPIGVSADGVPVDLDIKESAQGGVGPHGLLIGATGSGKSELLRSLVLGLAVSHAPDTLNFVLADFKGGATFLGLEELPHVSAVITNLEDELPLVDRMQDALRGEMNRRQELLRAAGNLSSVLDYERARAQGARGPDGAPLPPLPSLVIVVDEFSELLSQKPDFAELFTMIGRLGRSLAVHLLLASQRLEEGRLRGLETHLSYRLCLRTFSANESRMVLGVPDAHTLPTEPGNGYLKADVSSMTRFKATYVSGPYERPQPPEQVEAAARDRLVAYTAAPQSAPVEARPEAPAEQAARGQGTETPPEILLDVLVGRLRGHGLPAHRVWLPPLGDPATLDALLGGLSLHPRRGLTADRRAAGGLRAAVGEIDLPFEQRRAPLVADLSGAGGNAAVIGGPQSGKSTFIRTLICALALGHTPREVQFYALDFGGGALGTLAGLPHLGTIATRREPDLVHRTVAELTTLLDARERLFAESGFDSMTAYRAARSYDEQDKDPFGDVLLVVDGWGVLRSEFEPLEGAITALAARGLTYGIHVVVGANRWSELRGPLRDALGSRFELKLGDSFESEINRRLAANVPSDRPGRGLVAPGLEFLAALPRIDGKPHADSAGPAVRELVETVRAAWTGPAARPVRTLPERLGYRRVAELVPKGGPGSPIPLGLAQDDLGPVTLDFGQEQHYAVFGEAESGKSTVLRTVLTGLAERRGADEALFVLIDYRRTLLDAVPRDRIIGFATNAEAAQDAARQIHAALRARLPGPDVDPAALRDRAWWSGPELYLVVDDYDLVAGGTGNPLGELTDILAQSRDVGLHVLLARSTGGAGRAMYEPFLQRLRELGSAGLVLSGSQEEGPLLGDVTARRLPPGRGIHYTRRRGARLIQAALPPAADEEG